MQVDKNCNATGATTQNLQMPTIDGKHGNDPDGKLKDSQPQQQQNAKNKQQSQIVANDSYNHAPISGTTAASTPIGQTQSQIVTTASNQGTFDPMQQQHNVINRMITNIQQSNGSTKVQKIASESMIPTTRSSADSPNKNQTGNSANVTAHHHGKHQQNNSTSFPTNAAKTDGKNTVNCFFFCFVFLHNTE